MPQVLKTFTQLGTILNEKEVRALDRLDVAKNGLAPTEAMNMLCKLGLATRKVTRKMSGRGGFPSTWTVEKILITEDGCAWLRAHRASAGTPDVDAFADTQRIVRAARLETVKTLRADFMSKVAECDREIALIEHQLTLEHNKVMTERARAAGCTEEEIMHIVKDEKLKAVLMIRDRLERTGATWQLKTAVDLFDRIKKGEG